MPDERWGQKVVAFIKRNGPVKETALDAHSRDSGLANFKRPREYVFVQEIPKSPVGKILRRMLPAGEFTPEETKAADRKSVVEGKSVSVHVDHGGHHILQKKTQ